MSNEERGNELNDSNGSLSGDYTHLMTEKPYIAAQIKKHCPCGVAFDILNGLNIMESEVERLRKLIQENLEVKYSGTL